MIAAPLVQPKSAGSMAASSVAEIAQVADASREAEWEWPPESDGAPAATAAGQSQQRPGSAPPPVSRRRAWHVSRTHPPPGQPAGWVLSHDALRLDMADFASFLEALVPRLEAGRSLQPAQATAVRRCWDQFCHMLTVHHDSEEGQPPQPLCVGVWW